MPVYFIGTGAYLYDSTYIGLQISSKAFGISVPEVLNRATITGSIDIGRHPGVVTVTFLAPTKYLEKINILNLIQNQYL